ncbi:MAG: DsbE family thiol:disulfide interchange protein, partial [Sedimenticola sp.]|nr:DsbE family thiol:disulfide interchange protein [Sedimenticola sp.]
VSSESMKGKVWLLNVWGTWCPECWREHAFLNNLAKNEGVTLVGIDWRDEREEAKAFLAKKGNPFVAVGYDPESEAIMDWGVYGAPETFVIDKQGMIRKKHTGPLYQQIWTDEFKPLLKQLEAES